jgi:acylphosphatase
VRRRLLVSGRVQGVWYRESCRAEATARGVAGSARNRPDGRVEVVLEGAPGAVEAVAAWCREGPRRAHVEAVDERDEPPTGATGFEVR